MGTCMSIAKETFLKILHMIFTRSNPGRFNLVLISSHNQKVCHFKCYSICQDSVNLKVIVLFNGFFFLHLPLLMILFLFDMKYFRKMKHENKFQIFNIFLFSVDYRKFKTEVLNQR